MASARRIRCRSLAEPRSDAACDSNFALHETALPDGVRDPTDARGNAPYWRSKRCRIRAAVAEFRHDSGSDQPNLFQGQRPQTPRLLPVNLLEVPPLTFRRSRLCSGYGWFVVSRPFAQNSFVRTPARS